MMRSLVLAAALVATPALAADRALDVTDFDSIRIDGPFVVDVTTGRGPSGRASGTTRAIEGVDAEMQGRTLVIRRDPNGFGGWPEADAGPVRITVTTPALQSAWINGAGVLTVDRMRGPRIKLALEGSGLLSVGQIETDRLTIGMTGSGTMKLAGRAADVGAIVRGSASLDGSELAITDAVLSAEGSGFVALTANRTAKITAIGTGTVTIGGNPACTVKNVGAGSVACGR